MLIVAIAAALALSLPVAYLAWQNRTDDDVVAAGKTAGTAPSLRPTPAQTEVIHPEGEVDMTGRAPLTGLPADTTLEHPAVTVKISNTPDAHPHRGLEDADIVFVEPITGATTRLAAIFHSRLPAEAGPVRSLRPMDAPLIGPTRGVLANTMAQGWVLDYIDAMADVANLGTMRVPSGTYRLDPGRIAPNHVFASAEELLARTDRATPPTPYFRYAYDAIVSTAQLAGAPATTVTVGYGGSSTATWIYDHEQGRWLRAEEWSDHILENGAQVAADNVVVLRAARHWGFPQAGADMTILDLVAASGPVEGLHRRRRGGRTLEQGRGQRAVRVHDRGRRPVAAGARDHLGRAGARHHGGHDRSGRRWGQPVATDEVGQPVRRSGLQPVRLGELADLVQLERPGGHHVAQLPEEVFESGRADDLDHPCRHLSRIPHGVHLPAWLGDVPAWA